MIDMGAMYEPAFVEDMSIIVLLHIFSYILGWNIW